MADFSAIRAALAAQVGTITIPQPDGSTIPLRTGESGTVPGQVNPPEAVIRPQPGSVIEYANTMDGASEFYLWVTLFVSTADMQAAQQQMDGFLANSGALSVRAVLEKEQTLGGLAQYVFVPGATGYGNIDVGGVTYLSCSLRVTVGVA